MTSERVASSPPHVRLHLWGVPTQAIPRALGRMGAHRVALAKAGRDAHGPTFAKLLGTARPTTFTPEATDPRHWGLLSVWRSPDDADAFEDHTMLRSWQLIADETLRVAMTPVHSRGQWSRREPFGTCAPTRPVASQPLAAITRARVRPQHMRAFWHNSRAVASSLARADGLAFATGIGEAPVGLTGTFSLWRDAAAMNAFAHADLAHRDAVALTPQLNWYAEELFARLSVDDLDGAFAGRSAQEWLDAA